jgi:hypothetical protein
MNYIFTQYITPYGGKHHPGINILLDSIQSLNDDTIRVILFYHGYDDNLFHKHKDFLTIVDVNNRSKWLPVMFPSIQRWYLYRNYIEQNIYRFNNNDKFFHCDSENTIFQKNIFNEIENENKTVFFTEQDEFTLKSDATNLKQQQNLHNQITKSKYVPQLIQNISHNNIICSGTIYFDTLTNFIHFLSTYTAYQIVCMNNNSKFKRSVYRRMGEVTDQGVINSLVYNEPHPQFKILKNNYLKLVCAMSLMSKCNEQYDIEIKNNKIYINNIIPCVIHQYHKFEKITNFLETISFLYKMYLVTEASGTRSRP